MWHPTGDSSNVIGLADSHIITWDVDTGGKTAKVKAANNTLSSV